MASKAAEYSSPRIMEHRDLEGRMQFKSDRLDSDAEIKHAVEPVKGYEAPSITDERDLQGGLLVAGSFEIS